MRKIVILQDYLRNGGTERQSIHLARALSETGHDVTLLTFRPGGVLPGAPGTGTAPADDPKLQTLNAKLISLQPFDTRLDFFAPRLHATIRRLAPDIVLCMGRMANCKAGRIARAFPRTVVISTMRTGKKLPAAYIRSLHDTRHTIANSHEAARILRETHNVPAEKITVIHNALLTGGMGFQPMTENTSIHRLETDATLRLLCVAMFRPEKNHRELIELFSKLPAIPHSGLRISGLSPRSKPHSELHLVGDGPELAGCRALAQKLNIADRVHFHGYLADPAPFYQHPASTNTIAVLTSRSESLPNFLVEAHAHGIPSVAYNVGGVAECGGIAIPSGDQPAFIAALTRLMTTPAAHAAESARVTAHAREHFSPETQLQRYQSLFEMMMPLKEGTNGGGEPGH